MFVPLRFQSRIPYRTHSPTSLSSHQTCRPRAEKQVPPPVSCESAGRHRPATSSKTSLMHFQLPKKWSEFISSSSRARTHTLLAARGWTFVSLHSLWSAALMYELVASLCCFVFTAPCHPHHHKKRKEKRGRKKHRFSLWESWLCFDTQAGVEMKHWHSRLCCSTRCDAPGRQLLLLQCSCKWGHSCGAKPVACKHWLESVQ